MQPSFARIATIPKVVAALVLTVVVAACSGTTSLRAWLSGGATVLTPSASDLTSLSNAFHAAYDFPSTCPIVITPGSYKFASDDNGTRWAFARFSPAPSCSLISGGKPVTDFAHVPPFNNDPTGQTAITVRYTFERPDDGSWQVNTGSGRPFPCPAPNGTPPGTGNGSFPKPVLQAWGLSYARGCANVFFPQFPH